MFYPNLLAHTVGIFSLIASCAVVYPTAIALTNNSIIRGRSTLKISYTGLLVAICLGLIHGLLMTQSTSVDFYNLNSYWVYAVGIFAFNLLIFLAFTFSEFKKDLSKLNYFNYAIIFLLICHVGQKIIF